MLAASTPTLRRIIVSYASVPPLGTLPLNSLRTGAMLIRMIGLF
jgi:hypothetical protein